MLYSTGPVENSKNYFVNETLLDNKLKKVVLVVILLQSSWQDKIRTLGVASMFKSEKNCFLKMILIEFVRSGGKIKVFVSWIIQFCWFPFSFCPFQDIMG